MTDYDEIRTCCKGADICTLCWNFMTVSIKVLHSSLIGTTFTRTILFNITDDFGFKNLLWIYSGRRGVHCWVCDDKARALSAEGRKAIVGYLELLRGSGDNARKVNTRGPILHPHLNRSLNPCATMFANIMMGNMKIFDSQEQWSKILAIVPDEGITAHHLFLHLGIRKDLDSEWSLNSSLSAAQKWEMLQSRLKASKVRCSQLFTFHRNLEWIVSRGILYFSIPILDWILMSRLV